jgi:hypothetical protein
MTTGVRIGKQRRFEVTKFHFKLFFTMWPLFLGAWLPYVPIAGGGRLINLLWSLIYGLGLVLCFYIFGHDRPAIVFWGGLLYPLFLSAVLFWVSGKLWDNANSVRRSWAAGLLLLSAFCVIGLDRSFYPPFNVLPTYWKLMFIAY